MTTRVFVLTPPLVSEIWDFFGLFYYLQNFSPALRAEFLLSTELPKKPRGVFIIYKNVPQNQLLSGPFFDGFPLNNKQKPQQKNRAWESYYLQKIPRFARVFYYLQKNLPRFARRFYYLQNPRKSKSAVRVRGGLIQTPW